MSDAVPESPNPGLIYDLYTGVFRPQIVRMALQVDVFTPLADGPADAATVARACGCSEAGIARLLDVLAGAQVFTRHEGRYALTPSAATFLVRAAGLCRRPDPGLDRPRHLGERAKRRAHRGAGALRGVPRAGRLAGKLQRVAHR